MYRFITALLALIVPFCGFADAGPAGVKHYICSKTSEKIKIDGIFDEFSWAIARRVGDFERILSNYPDIERHTEASLLWDEENLYVSFSCQDPEMWTTMTIEDTTGLPTEEVAEVFIDPDGDGKNYLELEVNPLNVIFDLKIITTSPWEADADWDIVGLETAVAPFGTVNDPDDRDTGWNVEIAIPWKAFGDIASSVNVPPREGDQWRLNLYRVERKGGLRAKAEGNDFPLTEFTGWSATHKVGFHDPSRFGVVEFR